MRFGTVFRNHGRFIYKVTRYVGDLDLETGVRPKRYKYERVRALVGIKNFGLQMHLHLDETMVVLPSEASLVVIDENAYTLNLLQSFEGCFIYKKDKVLGDEFESIVGSCPPEGSN